MANPTSSVSKKQSSARLADLVRAGKVRKVRIVTQGQGAKRKTKIVLQKPADGIGPGKVTAAAGELRLPMSTVKILELPPGATVADARRMVQAGLRGSIRIVRVPPQLDRVSSFREFLAKRKVEVLAPIKVERPAEPPGRVAISSEATDALDLGTALRDPGSGKLDARKIAKLYGITLADLATKVCGITKQAIGKSPTSAGIQKHLEPLEEIANLLQRLGGSSAKFRAWLNRRNREFAPVNGSPPSPLELILLGRSAVVAHYVHNLLTGHPA